jgi:hypothetical protein
MKSKTQREYRILTKTFKMKTSLFDISTGLNFEGERGIWMSLSGNTESMVRDTRVKRQALIKQLKTLINKLEA